MVDVLMIGTGEYTTGYSATSVAESDKGAGVVGVVLIDLRRRGGRVKRLGLCGTNGKKMPAIRDHVKRNIGDAYSDMDCSLECFPGDDEVDPEAYLKALDAFKAGDLVTVFTPDDTHFKITKAALERGMHVLTTKPLVKTLEEHRELIALAREKNVLLMCEVHKRFDPIYTDARDRSAALGDFSFMDSYMSQPKTQLETFKSWAGQASDISYYLNSHHIDFHEWCVSGRARPVSVVASAATGVAKDIVAADTCEDTITLLVQWENRESGNLGTAVYTSSWIAPPGEVHSQQRFFYMGHKGELRVDQAHRGFEVATDAKGYASCNPLFMKYQPNPQGEFAGQLGYGYRSIEAFVDRATAMRNGDITLEDCNRELPTVETTMLTTAILEAGRRSLDSAGMPIQIEYSDASNWGEPTGLKSRSA
ncbi:Inositol 2-dehydrogenase [Hondaea fermentalgiana]|uniref:Inositol 2-dehydrogenase n=1 Tax=Hondaea fermentalgiana TaxID=2315210 RepID=A0A2R5GPS0_9STRA|nr:Inositol 2-dehydrogenase [Hondaea fermentalgiana]|eukprot:GBG32876.1 Inositol 2-dehydrogenase [Hondaea fermentalgiana]